MRPYRYCEAYDADLCATDIPGRADLFPIDLPAIRAWVRARRGRVAIIRTMMATCSSKCGCGGYHQPEQIKEMRIGTPIEG